MDIRIEKMIFKQFLRRSLGENFIEVLLSKGDMLCCPNDGYFDLFLQCFPRKVKMDERMEVYNKYFEKDLDENDRKPILILTPEFIDFVISL